MATITNGLQYVQQQQQPKVGLGSIATQLLYFECHPIVHCVANNIFSLEKSLVHFIHSSNRPTIISSASALNFDYLWKIVWIVRQKPIISDFSDNCQCRRMQTILLLLLLSTEKTYKIIANEGRNIHSNTSKMMTYTNSVVGRYIPTIFTENLQQQREKKRRK